MSTALTNAKQLWTTDPQRTFTGSAESEAGGIMEIVMDETVYSVAIAADGSWSWQPPFPLAEGPHNLSVRTIDRAGNIGAPSLLIVNVDLTAPDQPLIIGADDNAGDKTGPVSSGQQTDDRTPTLKGVAEPDSIVRLYNEQNQLTGSVKASSSGYWEITPTLADGEHALYVTATDGRGYVSKASETFKLTIADDAAAPAPGKVEITHALDDAGAAQGKLLDGALTDDTTPTLRGTAPAGSNVLIQYRDVNGQWVDGGYATLNGTEWSWTPDQALGESKWEFRANAGNGWTDEFTLEIDLTPQSELSITHAWDDFGINTGLLHSGAITDDRTPTLNGRAEANSLVYIHFRNALSDWELLGSVQAGVDGNWVYETDRISPGSYQFSASDNATAHNSNSDFSLTVVSGTGLKPSIIHAVDDFGNITGALQSNASTDDLTPEIRGRAEANATVYIQYREANGNWQDAGTTIADASGNWHIESPELTYNSTFHFRAQLVTNTENSEWSENFNISTTPDLPIILGAIDDTPPSTGMISNGGITDDENPILKGTGTPGEIIIIEYHQSSAQWQAGGSVVVDKNGEWTWQAPKLTLFSYCNFRAKNLNQLNDDLWSKPFHINLTSQNDGQILKWDFNDGTFQGWKPLEGYATGRLLQVSSWTSKGKSVGIDTMGSYNYKGEVMSHEFIVEKGKRYKISFDSIELPIVNFNFAKIGFKIDGQFVIPEQSLSKSWETRTGFYTASETKVVQLILTNGTSGSNGNDFSIDNITIEPVDNKVQAMTEIVTFDDSHIYLTGEEANIELSNLLSQHDIITTVDLSGHGNNALQVDTKTLLQHGAQDLFIEDGKVQMMVKGERGDSVKLADLVSDEQSEISWVQQNGHVTVGGIQYNVYSHNDAELLVQEGVKVELV
ncbi:hypothetical protein K7H94_02745 [Pantoea dispersa]|uniref:Ig-like domain-containing protein n=1 Tax=Pantoea dispersa TaxID=59814 RepID=UPI001CA78EC5|nr:Ig-like domain-containing protein [Pantoea dispersa]QZY90883.1 hypothetical protein K7H94_02745 [Pantoea dispersa]